MNTYLMVFLGALFSVCCGRQGGQESMKNSLVTNKIANLVIKWDMVKGTPAEVYFYAAQSKDQVISETPVAIALDQVAPVSPKCQRELIYCMASKHLFRGKEVMLIHYGIKGFSSSDQMYENFDKVLISQDDSGEWRVLPPNVWVIAIHDSYEMK